MKYFSAQYIFTNTSVLKRGIVCAEDDGTIISVEDSGGKLPERHSIEFHNGIIVPGFVNCHCHLELSHLKNEIPAGSGLASFLTDVTAKRSILQKDTDIAIADSDNEMYREGIVLCADICNSPSTFNLKKRSRIKYISLLEAFGIDPSKAEKRMNEILELKRIADDSEIPAWVVPHSVYSVSLPLFRLIKNKTLSNRITSIHFMESPDEETLLVNHSGSLLDSYKKFLPSASDLKIADNHIQGILEKVTPSGNLLLVHNTFVRSEHIKELKKRSGLFWCLCPNSNIYIEQKMPPVDILEGEGCNIVIGTDSLSSNRNLSIIDELKTIQHYYPVFSLETMIRWATLNGAQALCEDSVFGSIEKGKKPGLVLLKNVDLVNLKLLPGTIARRLI